MTEQAYKLWQQGMPQWEIADKLKLRRADVTDIIKASPKIRLCPVCGNEFEYDAINKKYCSLMCKEKNRKEQAKADVRERGEKRSEMTSHVKKDCFAFDGACKALDKLYCAWEVCRFYKTKKQYEREKRG